jgi:hypothetical protein
MRRPKMIPLDDRIRLRVCIQERREDCSLGLEDGGYSLEGWIHGLGKEKERIVSSGFRGRTWERGEERLPGRERLVWHPRDLGYHMYRIRIGRSSPGQRNEYRLDRLAAFKMLVRAKVVSVIVFRPPCSSEWHRDSPSCENYR